MIAHVGNTGRATNPAPRDPHDIRRSVGLVVDPAVAIRRTRNPQLWIEPLPGTVRSLAACSAAAANPFPAHAYTASSSRSPRNSVLVRGNVRRPRPPDPVFDENFAIGDVPAGEWVLGVEIEVAYIERCGSSRASVTEVVLSP